MTGLGLILSARGTSTGGGGGGGGGGGSVNWADIYRLSASASFSGTNAAQTMGATGTLNFSYAGAGITYAINKNGTSQGQASSVGVVSGDTISMTGSVSGMAYGELREGSITVSGLYPDTILVEFERDSFDPGGTS